MENGFEAKKTIFQGESGYMVEQVVGGKRTSSQFVTEEAYGDFCREIGSTPDLKE